MRKDIITKEAAMEIAKNRYSEINCCQEYRDAFYFFVENGQQYEGGSASGFVVLKKGGQIIMPYEYFMNPKSKAVEIGDVVLF